MYFLNMICKVYGGVGMYECVCFGTYIFIHKTLADEYEHTLQTNNANSVLQNVLCKTIYAMFCAKHFMQNRNLYERILSHHYIFKHHIHLRFGHNTAVLKYGVRWGVARGGWGLCSSVAQPLFSPLRNESLYRGL